MTADPTASTAAGWEFWIDRGGTFTDVVARRPDGTLITHKLLSENPERYADAAVHAIRTLLELPAGAPIPVGAIVAVKMGTTVATNALLERMGERTALVITKGFADALRIAYQNRPKLFVRRIELPALLYERVIEADERMGAHGDVVRPLDLESVRRDLEAARDAGIAAVAIVLMHGYRFPDHEKALAELAVELGFTQVSVSHAVCPLMKLISRGDTTVVDAYLSPILRRYVNEVERDVAGVTQGAREVAMDARRQGAADETVQQVRRGGGDEANKADARYRPRLQFMQSNGGLPTRTFSRGRTRSSPAPRAESSAPSKSRDLPDSTGSSASTWAARRPTSRTTQANTSGRSSPRSPVCGLRRR
jgi:N-methylhydantoinase A/oxoprolinase/acetone carboxylase beta subunit